MKKSNTVLKIAIISCLTLALMPLFASAALFRQLEIGARGADVSELQTFLASDASVYPQGLVTGYFGSLTRAAVIRFQAKNGISQVGRVGPQTMAAINAQMGTGGVNSPEVQRAPGFTSLPSVSFGVSTSTSGGTTTSATSTANISLTTDVPTQATLYYSTSPIVASENITANPVTVSVSGTPVRTSTNFSTNHVIATLPLESNRTYYYMVVVNDTNGVTSVTYPRLAFSSNF